MSHARMQGLKRPIKGSPRNNKLCSRLQLNGWPVLSKAGDVFHKVPSILLSFFGYHRQ